jgi:ATP-dependent 26S proteasome regulatory subunit
VLHVPTPNAAERQQLLEYFARKCRLGAAEVARLAALLKDGMSGAEVENLCREASLKGLHEQMM